MDLIAIILEILVSIVTLIGAIIGIFSNSKSEVSIEKRIHIISFSTYPSQKAAKANYSNDKGNDNGGFFIIILFALVVSIWLNGIIDVYLRIFIAALLLIISILYFLQCQRIRLANKEQLKNLLIITQPALFSLGEYVFNRTYDVNQMALLFKDKSLTEVVSTFILQFATLKGDSPAYAMYNLIHIAFSCTMIIALICFMARTLITFIDFKNERVNRILCRAATSKLLYLPYLFIGLIFVETFIFGMIPKT